MSMYNDIKTTHLGMLHDYRQRLREHPELRYLFFELTMRCNEHCRHCGSYCGDKQSPELPKEKYFEILSQIKDRYKKLPMLCITGGEPMLRKEIYEIMGTATEMGYHWGMTSNGTLITKDAAKRLKDAGMKTISISIDGLEETHDSFRQTKGGFRRACEGVKNLLDADIDVVQVTTVVTKKNIDELDGLFELVQELDVDSWRVINIEPIGRALSLDGYTLDPEDYRRMFRYIADKRKEGYPVTYGCTHFLGLDYECEVRDWYFLCNAGVYTASILANGDIMGCLDIERRPETIEGNVLKDDFIDVWENRFKIYRTPLSEKNEKCRSCEARNFCEGGAYHSWNYDDNRQMVCFKDVLF